MVYRIIVFCVAAILMVSYAHAQKLIPFRYTSEEDNKYIRENDSVKFYEATGDTSEVVGINEEASTYKLYDRERKLLVEGNFVTEGDKLYQDGKWTEFYDGGKVKKTGWFKMGMPIGTWEEYYSGGKVKNISNYGIFSDQGVLSSCLSGSYTEYYTSGKLKANGFYAAVATTIYDTVSVYDPVSATDREKTIERKKLIAEKTGHWEYYDENGEMTKKEDL